MGTNKKVTEFFPVRRSVRKTKKEVQEERSRQIERCIRDEREDGLAVNIFNEIFGAANNIFLILGENIRAERTRYSNYKEIFASRVCN